jgi:hypothetical protein
MGGAWIDHVGIETWEVWVPGGEKPVGVALTRADAVSIACEHDRKMRALPAFGEAMRGWSQEDTERALARFEDAMERLLGDGPGSWEDQQSEALERQGD